GGLADAGVAAHQDCRSAHEPAAGDTVEFTDAGDDARSVLDLAGQCRQRHRSAGARLAQRLRSAADTAYGAFLDKRVPLAAAFALAGPARMHRAAILADELETRLCHQH